MFYFSKKHDNEIILLFARGRTIADQTCDSKTKQITMKLQKCILFAMAKSD